MVQRPQQGPLALVATVADRSQGQWVERPVWPGERLPGRNPRMHRGLGEFAVRDCPNETRQAGQSSETAQEGTRFREGATSLAGSPNPGPLLTAIEQVPLLRVA
jgi:hypothetical protein